MCRNMEATKAQKADAAQIARYADMFSAMGTEPRLRIMRLLLAAHPDGMVVGELPASSKSPTRLSRITSTN